VTPQVLLTGVGLPPVDIVLDRALLRVRVDAGGAHDTHANESIGQVTMDDYDLCPDRGFIPSTGIQNEVNRLDHLIHEDGAAAGNTDPNRIISDHVGLELQPGSCLGPY
jgi:hypothetical protein